MTSLSSRLLESAILLPSHHWDALAHPEASGLPHPFTRRAFFVALEQSGSATARTGWRPSHLVIERGGEPVGLLPLYLKSHSYGEYVFDHSWADAYQRAGGRYYPKLQASVPFTPASGRRLLVAPSENTDELRGVLLNEAAKAVRLARASSLHITFMCEDEWRFAGEHGWLQRTDQQFHWENRGYDSFEGFLADLSSNKRKNLRKERAAVAAEGVTFDWLTGPALTEASWDAFFAGYTRTGNTKWNPPYLTREFFSRIGETMNEQILLVMAKRNGRYIAGALNFFDETTLFGRNWGALTYVPFLHFEACYYQAIDFAIARGLKRVEAGAQGGHKLLRGYMPQPTYSAHYVADPAFARVLADYLARERRAVAEHIEELAELAPFRQADGS